MESTSLSVCFTPLSVPQTSQTAPIANKMAGKALFSDTNVCGMGILMGTLQVYSKNAEATSVSNLFIDEYMKEANDAQIKVYLYLVRMMHAGRSTSIADMADQFNHTEKEVLRSLTYWEKKGLVSLNYDARGELTGIHLCDTDNMPSAKAGRESLSVTPMVQSVTQTVAFPTISSEENEGSENEGDEAQALAAFRTDADRAELLFIIEQYLGKPLSVSEIKAVYYISSQLHFSDDLIDYLMQYCIDRGKKDFRYIQQVAKNWAENGITTPKQAERKASSLLSQNRSSRNNGMYRSNNRQYVNPFNQFQQRDYDYDELERQLLSN